MASENLWGELGETSGKPPVAHLQEQATRLGEMTKNVLYGSVYKVDVSLGGVPVSSGDIAFNLDIVAPAMDDYAYTVLQVRHRVSPYPVRVYTPREGAVAVGVALCQSEAAFLRVLKRVLSSQRVQRVVQSLLAQSKALR